MKLDHGDKYQTPDGRFLWIYRTDLLQGNIKYCSRTQQISDPSMWVIGGLNGQYDHLFSDRPRCPYDLIITLKELNGKLVSGRDFILEGAL